METIKDEVDPVLASYLKGLEEMGIKYEVTDVPAVPLDQLAE